VANQLGINYSTAKTILRIWRKEDRITKKYSSTNIRKRKEKKKRLPNTFKPIMEIIRSTNFAIISDKCESTMSNSFISQPVDIINLMNSYNSYTFLKNIGNAMILYDKITLCKLFNTCNVLVDYINRNLLIERFPGLQEVYERLNSNLF
jgi:hypothetical protein